MNKETFSYTYSANEQEEIRRIREKYQPGEADKMEQLRRLDESTTRKGTPAIYCESVQNSASGSG